MDGQRRAIRELLDLIARGNSPFTSGLRTRRARFVEPRLEADVRFVGWDAGVLREPILAGLRMA
jgi:hypothetical protein